MESEKKCPHYEKLKPLTAAIDEANVIILASPVYVYHATGAGMKWTNKDMMDSLFFWGVAKRYKYGVSVAAVNWNGVNEKKKRGIDKATSEIAKKIINDSKNVKSGIKTKGMFWVMRFMQKIISNPRDVAYWEHSC